MSYCRHGIDGRGGCDECFWTARDSARAWKALAKKYRDGYCKDSLDPHGDAQAILGLHMDQGQAKKDDTPWTMTASRRRELITAVSKLMEIVRKLAEADPVVNTYTGGGSDDWCLYCKFFDTEGSENLKDGDPVTAIIPGPVIQRRHDDDCPWVIASGMIDFLDGGGVS